MKLILNLQVKELPGDESYIEYHRGFTRQQNPSVSWQLALAWNSLLHKVWYKFHPLSVSAIFAFITIFQGFLESQHHHLSSTPAGISSQSRLSHAPQTNLWWSRWMRFHKNERQRDWSTGFRHWSECFDCHRVRICTTSDRRDLCDFPVCQAMPVQILFDHYSVCFLLCCTCGIWGSYDLIKIDKTWVLNQIYCLHGSSLYNWLHISHCLHSDLFWTVSLFPSHLRRCYFSDRCRIRAKGGVRAT